MSVNHYENFPVASMLCPSRLRPAVAAIYGFARTADDLADEGVRTTTERLADLQAYRSDLLAASRGTATSNRWHDVFSALAPAMVEHQLPLDLFTDLLSAFEQDLSKTTYTDRAELVDYCGRSANPVGRLLLQLYGVTEPQALAQSDAICTALQLVNFWQDLSVDVPRGRLYLPLADCEAQRLSTAQVMARKDSATLHTVLQTLVQWTRAMMDSGAPLVHRLPGRAGWELRLVVQGGLRILEKIEAMNFKTLHGRPTLKPWDWPLLVWRAMWMKAAADHQQPYPTRSAKP